MDERQQLEQAVINTFMSYVSFLIRSYNAQRGTNFKIIEHRAKPDFLIQDEKTGEKMGLDALHLYYEGKEAQMRLGWHSNELDGVTNGDFLIRKLNSGLAEKIDQATKYGFDGRMWLIVRVASPIFDWRHFEIFKSDILFPMPNPFEKIWLLFSAKSTKPYCDLIQIV